MEDRNKVVEQPQSLTQSMDISGQETTSGISSSLRCHVGAKRTENQDRVGRFVTALGELIVVADGVGGSAGGAQAATIAVEEYGKLRAKAQEKPTEALQRTTRAVNKRIEALRQADSTFSAMASTVAVVLLQDRSLIIGHLGDSRVYLARAGTMRLLTRDHSVVQKMVDDGIITEQQALTHPKGHILTSSLGQEGVELELLTVGVELGDMVLVCSDGLWAYVPEATLAHALASSGHNTAIVANSLLDLALAADAPDNVSIALLHVGATNANQTAKPSKARPGRGKLLKHSIVLSLAAVLIAAIVWLILQHMSV